ncbi:MAG TPA: hypothetical protein VF071_07185 [Candidatus Limnocylindria bacterium]
MVGPLLGLIAAIALGYGALLLVAGLIAGGRMAAPPEQTTAIGTALVGLLAIGYGLVAGWFAVASSGGRPVGTGAVLVVAAIAVLTPVVVRFGRAWHPALLVIVLLGVVLVGVLIAGRSSSRRA